MQNYPYRVDYTFPIFWVGIKTKSRIDFRASFKGTVHIRAEIDAKRYTISPIGWENIILYGEYVLNRDLIK